MTKTSQNGFETEGRVKRLAANREVNPYDSRLLERAVTLGCTQFQALTVPENAQRNLNRQRAVIVESNSYLMELT